MKKLLGFSLLEVLIVFSLIMILSFALLPSHVQLIRYTKSNVLLKEFLMLIRFTQQQAQALGEPLTLCPSQDGKQCSKNWNEGRIVFIDRAQQGHVLHAEDIILKSLFKTSAGNVQFRSARGLAFLSYDPIADVANNGTFSFYQKRQAHPEWEVIVNTAGRPRVQEFRTK